MTTNKSQPYSVESLFRGLRGLLGSLPTEVEKRELLRTLEEAQEFLEDLRILVDAIPTMESSQELTVGLSRLDSLTDRAHRDAPLRKLLGMRGRTGGREKSVSAHAGDIQEQVSQLADQVSQSETHEIRALLERESVAALKELAGRFGMRTPSKERKVDLVGRIVNHVENQRGYALLRGGKELETEQFP